MFFKQEVVILALTGRIQRQKKNGEWICAGLSVNMKFLFATKKLRVTGHDRKIAYLMPTLKNGHFLC